MSPVCSGGIRWESWIAALSGAASQLGGNVISKPMQFRKSGS
jgi:hypothetical protein